MCPIFANEGLPDIPSGFMTRVTDPVHSEGGLVIADEVQLGHGRTGRWWGYRITGFRPDIVVAGKPTGNGLAPAARNELRVRIDTYDTIGDVRGCGLFISVEMIKDGETCEPDAKLTMSLSDRLKDKGFLTSYSGRFNNVLKIRPPLVFSHANADEFLDAFDVYMEELSL